MSRLFTISSGDFTAVINSFGAELSSFIHNPSGTEFIWQAKPVWPRHAPVLFPFVGRLKGFQYTYNQKSYTIEQHGFARDLDFVLIEKTPDKLILGLQHSDITLQKYPFEFLLQISFSLVNNYLKMGFEIHNQNSIDMPVSFGGHPAFNLKSLKDTYLEFEMDSSPKSWSLDGNYLSGKTKEAVTKPFQIQLSDKTFEKDALIFKYLESNYICLKTKKDSYSVKVEIKDWPYLGIWAKPAAPFVCIEPWQGLADNIDFLGDIKQKEGILLIPVNSRIYKSFVMEFNP